MKTETVLDRRIRGRLGLMGQTQRDLCGRMGVTYVTLRAWLRGGPLSLRAREKLAAGLGVDESWLSSESYEDAGDGLDAICQ